VIYTGNSRRHRKRKSKPVTVKPLRQGELDGLCGVYSIINATQLVVGQLPKQTCYDLFYESLKALEPKRPLSILVSTGINTNDIALILQKVICSRYKIQRCKFFHTSKGVSVNRYWIRLLRFMRGRNRSVILSVASRHWSHWTAIRSVSERRILCFDSTNRKVIYKAHCATGGISQTKPLQLYPSPTFFLWKH
jgi:hypothetical protein